MSTCTAYHLVLGTKSFPIPTFFRNLNDVKPEILTTLQKNGNYHVKSDVKEDVFGSFVKFLIQGEIFDVKKENYSQYHQLSQEFDMMKDIIELHRKKLIKTSALIYKNEKLKNKMKKKGEKLIQISKNYEEINRILFTNKMMISTYYNFLKVKEKLICACKEQNVDFVNCLSSKKVKDLGCKLIFILNEQKKTATIYRNNSVDEEILIPRTIEHDSVEYIVDGFLKNSNITESPAHSVTSSVRFSKDVEIKSIPMCFAGNSNITTIEIPPSVEEIQMDNLLKNTTLARIKVSPKNTNFIYYDDSFLIGKSDKKSDIFDVLYFVRRNINYAVVPSFIKYVKGYAFAGCKNIIGVEFSEESELKSISKNAFFESSVKKLILPSSVEELESGWCDGLYNLNCIKVIKNKKQNISIYEDNFILGKSDPNSDVFDVLLFAKRDIKEALIPSFIKIISSYAFANYLLEKVEFSKDSQLFSIEKFAFCKTKLKSILIPLHVFQIGKSAFELSTINKICFMQNSELEKIGSRAFFKCNKLEKVECEIINIHNTLLIRKYAFQDCVLLNAVDFLNKPEKLIIEKNAFLNTQLKLPSNVVFKNAIFNDDNYEYENGIRNVNQSFTKHISSYSFSDYNIKEITIPSSVIHIHHNAFIVYSEVEKITFPDHLQKIDEFAFSRCINLKTIEFSEKSELNYIGDFAFADTPIEKIMIPSHVKRIGIEAFSKCNKLKKVTFSENSELNSIDKKAFYMTGIESISIPDSVIYVGDSCFSGCETLQTINFSEKSKIQSIGKHLFLESYLQNISIPSSIVSIDDDWCYQMEDLSPPTVTIHQNEIQNIKYYDNKFIIGKSDLNSNSYDILILTNQNIETAIIPSFIKKISPCAFNRCYNLQNIIFSDDSELTEICPSPFDGSSIESIIVPPKVTKIHSFTFAGMYTLKNVEFSDKTESLTIERDAFNISEIEKIVIPSDAILKDGWCHMTSNLKYINLIEKPNSRIKLSENQILLGKTDDNNEEYDNLLFLPHEIKSFTIPSYITKISPYVFEFSQIRSIIIDEQSKLRKIDKDSFHSSSIESVYIPSNITEIGSRSFCCCQKLKRVDFAENSQLKTIEKNAFDTTALECIYIPDSVIEIKENAFQRSRYLKYIIISDKSELKYIGRRAFHITAITQFFVPKSVREIDATAFDICDILQIIEIQENSSLKILTFNKRYCHNTKIIMIPADLRNNIEIVFDDSF